MLTSRAAHHPGDVVAAAAAHHSVRRRFYVSMAIAVLVTTIMGFGRSVALRTADGAALPTRAMLHGLLFFSWVMVFVAQTVLVATGNVKAHRRLGRFAIGLALLMIVTAVPTAFAAAGDGTLPGDPLAFLLVMLTDLLFFAAFAALGIHNRQRPETHKRFMLLAMISLLPPGISRWPVVATNPPLVAVAMVAFLAAAPLRDLLGRHRMHPVSLWGGLTLLASVPLRFAIAQTQVWHQLARWLIR